MKRRSPLFAMFALFLSCLMTISTYAQTAKDIFNSSETAITYLGIDFTQARLIGDAGADAIDIKNRIYSNINQVVVNEWEKKYNFSKALQKSNIPNDLSIVEARNAKIDADKIKSTNSADESRLKATDIEKLVKEYNFNGKKGVGLVLFMEGMNKTAEHATFYVTFVDMDTKKVLFQERMVEKAGGFGFRNYWCKPVAEAIKHIEKSKYKEWKNRS
ncbi:MAG: hypothetical protein H7Y27_02040 [Gemmatimonadaceae bacterium]|nr:hypothetical protein [Chitinophagaceae bacterium]